MRFVETALEGAYIIEPETFGDLSGGFTRTFSANEFEAKGLTSQFVQSDAFFSHTRGTLHGIHFQMPPSRGTKVIRCLRGKIYAVIVDMRPESSTFLFHVGFKLSAANRRSVYVPELFACAFQTLTDGAEVEYQKSEFYSPQYERGMRYDDPVLRIEWPLPVTQVAQKDLSWPLMVNVVKPGH